MKQEIERTIKVSFICIVIGYIIEYFFTNYYAGTFLIGCAVGISLFGVFSNFNNKKLKKGERE